MKPVFRFLFAFLLVLMLCAPAKAEVLTFYGDTYYAALSPSEAEANFQSNLTDIYIEGFETEAVAYDVEFANGVSADLLEGERAYRSGSRFEGDYSWHTGSTDTVLTINFLTPVNSFGVFMGDLDVRADVVATIGDTRYNVPNPYIDFNDSGQFSFWGIINTVETFDQIVFSGLTMHVDWDNMQIGTPIASGDTSGPVPTPEPSTFLLLGAGIAGLAFMRRKRA